MIKVRARHHLLTACNSILYLTIMTHDFMTHLTMTHISVLHYPSDVGLPY